ncbi:MAG: N-acetyltransferase [Paludibacter sp.]|nr:N-acetyltransferase [Bacteroidales bacterium]MCM1068671.1 N-acetyltransferase [Prevotella sp.]MCM1353335.1 N-acetyltransferase [Bacteroides sp.]MCM1442257.1 N-acetyltransferase [Muribaculum sp.]MCM1481076.1 N-acetyltransferase [Paludibacter sp.]
MAVEIREIKTKKDIKKFIQFGNDLYKDCENYCPALLQDELDTFDVKKNPVHEVSEHILYLAYRDGNIVGRIAGIVNYAANSHWNVKKVRFGWMDFIDDLEVSKALLDAVAAWGKSKGMDTLNGPVGFTDLDHEGLLIEGFEYLAPMASLYNYPYYIRHMEAYGLVKENDWIEFQLTPPDTVPERLARMSKIAAERSRVRVDKVKNVRELIRKYGYSYFDVIDTAYQHLYNFQPLTPRQKKYYSEMYFPLLNFDFVTIVVNEKDEIVAVGVGMPDISEALRKSGGKLFPFGWYHIIKALRAKKMESFDLLLIAVHPDYQNKGVNSLIIVDQIPYFQQYGIKRVETTSIMETNAKNQANWEYFDRKQHKRRRAYIKSI